MFHRLHTRLAVPKYSGVAGMSLYSCSHRFVFSGSVSDFAQSKEMKVWQDWSVMRISACSCLCHFSQSISHVHLVKKKKHIDGRNPVIFQLWFAPGGRDSGSGCFLVELRHAQVDWSMWSIRGLLLAQDGRNSDTKIAKKSHR